MIPLILPIKIIYFMNHTKYQTVIFGTPNIFRGILTVAAAVLPNLQNLAPQPMIKLKQTHQNSLETPGIRIIKSLTLLVKSVFRKGLSLGCRSRLGDQCSDSGKRSKTKNIHNINNKLVIITTS